MPIERRFGKRRVKLLLEEVIDLDARSPRLIPLEFNGPRDHGLPILSRAAAIPARLPPQSGKLLLTKPPNLASQRRQRDSLPPAVGEQHLFLTQVLEKPSPLSYRNLIQQDGAQEQEPEVNPLLILI